MTSTEDRIQSLKEFKPIMVLSFNHAKRRQKLYFEPYLGFLRVEASENPDELPEFAISMPFIINGSGASFRQRSKLDECGIVTSKIYKAWSRIPNDKKEDFRNSLPLNSLFLGGDTI